MQNTNTSALLCSVDTFFCEVNLQMARENNQNNQQNQNNQNNQQNKNNQNNQQNQNNQNNQQNKNNNREENF